LWVHFWIKSLMSWQIIKHSFWSETGILDWFTKEMVKYDSPDIQSMILQRKLQNDTLKVTIANTTKTMTRMNAVTMFWVSIVTLHQ
jgi:hypothetical protein